MGRDVLAGVAIGTLLQVAYQVVQLLASQVGQAPAFWMLDGSPQWIEQTAP